MKPSCKIGSKESGGGGGFGENRGSIGASGVITYSTLANVPKAKRTKLVAEANPMVSKQSFIHRIAAQA